MGIKVGPVPPTTHSLIGWGRQPWREREEAVLCEGGSWGHEVRHQPPVHRGACSQGPGAACADLGQTWHLRGLFLCQNRKKLSTCWCEVPHICVFEQVHRFLGL